MASTPKEAEPKDSKVEVNGPAVSPEAMAAGISKEDPPVDERGVFFSDSEKKKWFR
jgi:hypothetical protein